MLPVPSTYAGVNTLGHPIKVYKTSLLHPILFFGLAGIMLGIAVVAFFALQVNGQAAAAAGFDLGLYGKLAPLLPVGIAVVSFFRALSMWGRAVVVYEHGLAFKNRRGVQAWRWADIQSFYASIVRTLYLGIIPTSTSRLYTVTNGGNDIFTFDQTLSHAQDLAEDIRRAIHPLLLARSLQAFNAGQTVAFGMLGLSQQGLHYNGRTYPWTQVKDLKVQDGQLTLHSLRVYVPTASISNLDVFLTLYERQSGQTQAQ